MSGKELLDKLKNLEDSGIDLSKTEVVIPINQRHSMGENICKVIFVSRDAEGKNDYILLYPNKALTPISEMSCE